MDSDKGLVPDLNLDRLSVVKGPKNKMKRKRNVSVSGASDGKKNKTRARNFTEDETVVVMEEGKKSRRLLKGRFGPSVTNDLKEERWQQIADNVNQLNGKNDRTWESVRKKFHDVMSSARCKGRTQVREMKETGGGRSTVPVMSKAEAMIIESIPDSVISGLACGYDSNSSSKESESSIGLNRIPEFDPMDLSVPLSQILKQSTSVLFKEGHDSDDTDDSHDTEISFDAPLEPRTAGITS